MYSFCFFVVFFPQAFFSLLFCPLPLHLSLPCSLLFFCTHEFDPMVILIRSFFTKRTFRYQLFILFPLVSAAFPPQTGHQFKHASTPATCYHAFLANGPMCAKTASVTFIAAWVCPQFRQENRGLSAGRVPPSCPTIRTAPPHWPDVQFTKDEEERSI
jgi:hypothetical protein